jgi:hypothetical protein
MNRFLLRSTLLLFLIQTALLPGAPAGAEPLTVRDLPGVMGIFLQPGADNLARDEAYWLTLFQKLRKENIDTLFLQWSAENGRVFADLELENHEKTPFLERIFQAARKAGIKVFLGLYQETTYWQQIPAPLDVLENFFYLRVAANERLLEQLHKKFGQEPALAGYYLPDEIDDLNWRTPDRIGYYNQYLKLMVERVRAYDPQRPVAISAFFRSRTAPRLFSENLKAILKDSGVNLLLLQDGAGEGNPGEAYRAWYFEALREQIGGETVLGAVIEIFSRTTSEGEPFKAVPASSARVQSQLTLARKFFRTLVVFSLDYLEP